MSTTVTASNTMVFRQSHCITLLAFLSWFAQRSYYSLEAHYIKVNVGSTILN